MDGATVQKNVKFFLIYKGHKSDFQSQYSMSIYQNLSENDFELKIIFLLLR